MFHGRLVANYPIGPGKEWSAIYTKQNGVTYSNHYCVVDKNITSMAWC